MAGDWIKLRTALARDGRLLIASRKCHANVTDGSQIRHSPVTVLGAVVMLWCHADSHADENGVLAGYVPEDIDALVGLPGFCSSLPADWLAVTADGWVQLPDFHKHNGDNAKKRAGAQKRKWSQRVRDGSHAEGVTSVTEESRAPRSEIVTREEKRRVQSPIVPKGTDDPLLNRAKALLRIQPSTLLDSGQANAWKKNKGAVAQTSEADWLALEWFFKQPSDQGDVAEYRRTTLGALLNHWSDEVVKARRAAAKMGVSFAAEKKKAAEIPDDWKGLLLEASPEFVAPERFEELPESLRSLVWQLAAEKKKGGENGAA